MPIETSAKAIVDRLEAEGWVNQGGTKHAKFCHANHPGIRIMVPRHKTLTPGVARSIGKAAGWH
ncbi:type II toxin-antitoxin system HicA family toxin [Lichenihabitans sp. Uapishka_5]|uniref:type II toxin-antitoxin system HicA family toxin n=1 Tax=Lichenihabitans sp. Uapishka_5 TaxID=3037302 RepID=UPI0029E7F407|nr:type II toxin-antitoxin system HicA family toxin [Lichenihabitans sp. Uapishka_5]MDX7952671.1 type II toxin-antitoxin system HicA family toxin [Lichenihabitans sp. Uapishka_5]